jgi:tryptophan synthase alpha chain
MTLAGVLEVAGRIRATSPVPLVLFTYFNPIYRMGVAEFARQAARAGVDGVLVTDLPPDEDLTYARQLAATGLDPIFMLAPTSGPERTALVARSTGAFIYYISRAGVTGAQGELPAGLREEVARIRLTSSLPVAVGFGVSRRAHMEFLAGAADAAVVGSARVRCMEGSAGGAAAVEAVRRCVRELLGREA